MDPLANAFTAAVASLISGSATYAAAYATAESELFAPLRTRLKDLAKTNAVLRIHEVESPRELTMKLVHFVAELHGCLFCSSWWHALWVTPIVAGLLGCSTKIGVVVYLGSVGVAKVLADRRAAKATAVTSIADAVRRLG